MPIDMQAKLLRVLQDGIVTRLGDTKAMKVDVRIIAATNERLFEKSQRGEFRADLYFRLSVVEIVLPPLRDRGNDVDLLVHSILERLRDRLGQPSLGIDDGALARLRTYGWPGNIRELENVLETAAIMTGGVTIDVAALPSRIADLKSESADFVDHGTRSRHSVRATSAVNSVDPSPTNSEEDRALQNILFKSPASKVAVESNERRFEQLGDEDCSIRDLEARAIRNALQKYNCNVSEASRSLGISRSSIHRKMRGSGIVKMSLVN
jgi:sigma-54 dependent transcriptional regulator, acetoin dehydrogenase operon transcriptional activator AcoR